MTVPHPGALLDPLIHNATSSSMKLGIMLHDDTIRVPTSCQVLQIARLNGHAVGVARYSVHFVSSIVVPTDLA